MKRSSMFSAATPIVIIGLALPASASEPEVQPAMDTFIQNTKTSEDHEAIAAYFDVEAALRFVHSSTALTFTIASIPR